MMKIIKSRDLFDKYDMTYLKSASTFGALSSEAIQWLVKNGAVATIDTDDCVFEHSERGDSFFVILEGRLSYHKWHNDIYTFIRHYEFGQQIGFMSLIALHPRVGKAVADKDSIILKINSDIFYQLHLTMPQDFGLLMMNLAREMSRTLCAVENIIVDRKDNVNR